MAADPEKSIALPFTPRPAMLTGELIGDVGFDPLGFSEEVRNREKRPRECYFTCTSTYQHVVKSADDTSAHRLAAFPAPTPLLLA